MSAADQIGAPALPGLIKQTELAEMFRCTTRTIRNWESTGRLKAIRIGRSTYYLVEDVNHLIGIEHDINST